MENDNNKKDGVEENQIVRTGSPEEPLARKDVVDKAIEAVKKAQSLVLVTVDEHYTGVISLVGANQHSMGDAIRIMEAFKKWAGKFKESYDQTRSADKKKGEEN